MDSERRQESGLKSGRQHARKEWGHGSDEQHQMEAREHARQPGKAQLSHAVRAAEAERQIRELRGRY